MSASPVRLKRPLIIDTHADTPQRFADDGWSFTDPLPSGHLNLDSARAGGLSAEFLAIWVHPEEWRSRYAFRTLQLIDSVYEQLRRHPDTMCLALSAAEIEAAYREDMFCVLLGLEGGHSIENDLGLLRMYFRLGIRYMTLTWTNSNEWADSSGDLETPGVLHHGGLTNFGREVIREMNRLGMMVDLSHVADSTFWDVAKVTRAPLFASHSCARALASSARNLTDEQLRAVAASGGVVMVNFYPGFLDDAWRSAWGATLPQREKLYAAAEAPFRERGLPVPYSVALSVDRRFFAEQFPGHNLLPTLDRVVDHILHVARFAGIEHVGLGSDFDGFPLLPSGLASAADLPKLAEALTARGLRPHELDQLLGQNILRVMRSTEALAD